MPLKEHSEFQNPKSGDITIWRYMSIVKFLSLLDNKSLFSPNLINLPDKYEGYLSDATGEYLKNQNSLNYFNILKKVENYFLFVLGI